MDSQLGWHRRRGIEAYTSHTSVKAGDTLNVHVSTYPVNTYSVSIYRMGYTGGAGARLMQTFGPLQGTAEPRPQDGVRNLIECHWRVGFSLEIPKDWLSGVYMGKLSTLPSATGQYLDLEMVTENLRHLHRPRQSQGRPLVPGLRHDLAVLQPLAPMAVAVRPRERAMGLLEQQGPLRHQVRSASTRCIPNGTPRVSIR